MTADWQQVSLGCGQCPGIRHLVMVPQPCEYTEATELCTQNGCMVYHVNSISVKLIKTRTDTLSSSTLKLLQEHSTVFPALLELLLGAEGL